MLIVPLICQVAAQFSSHMHYRRLQFLYRWKVAGRSGLKQNILNEKEAFTARSS